MQHHAAELLAGLAATDLSAEPTELLLDDRGHSLAASLTALVGTINLRAVAAAQGALLLHAGGVCRPDGGTAVLCGPSGSGKSTLTATLAVRGRTYLTDETVCLAPQSLRITPFRRPLSLKPGSRGVLPQLCPAPGSVAELSSDGPWFVPPGRLGGAEPPDEPLAPRVVVFSTYEAGAGLRVERVEPAEAAYLLGGNTVRLGEVHGGGLPALARLARRAPAYRLIHGDIEAAADTVERLWADAA